MSKLIINIDEHNEFRKIFRLANTNPRQFKYHIDHTKMSINEKKLLKAFYYYKKNKKEDCLELVKNKITESHFLEGVRLYLIGLVYNQFGHLRYAVENLEKSIAIFKRDKNNEFIINPLCTLALSYGNRREIDEMKACLKQLKKITTQDSFHFLQIRHVEILYFLLTKKYKKVHEFINEIKNLKNKSVIFFKPYFQIIQISAFIGEEKYSQCYVILESYKKEKGHTVKANYAYLKILLDHIVYDKPMYIYKKNFEKFPELYHQLLVINHLSLGEIESASNIWKKLSFHNKQLYQDKFQYSGEPTLFSRVLSKYLKNTNYIEIDQKKLNEFKFIRDRIKYIFEQTIKPIPSDKLIALIWGEETNSQNQARLRKIISDFNKTSPWKIISKQSTYQRRR